MSEEAGEEASPGTRLRLAREARGMSPESAASSLYIDLARIEAMEADDLAALGAPVFARGHLRKYALLLGLEPESVLPSVDAPVLANEPSFISIVDHRRRAPQVERYLWPAGALLLAVVVVLAVWWWYQRAPQAVPAATTGATVAEPVAETAVAAISAVATKAADLVFEIVVLRDCWIEVTDAEGRQLVFELAAAGTSRQLTGTPPVRVKLGDAAAAQLAWQGGVIRIPAAAIHQNVARFELGAGAQVTPLAAVEG